MLKKVNIKNAYRCPIIPNKITRSKTLFKMDETVEFDEEGFVIPHGVSLMDP